MTLKMKSMPLAISYAIASGALSVAVMSPAVAQTQPQGETPAMQRVVVTGSMISRADKETPSPVQVLTADDLAKSGFTSVAEVLNNVTANGNGALSQSFSGAFATGAGGISLRGLTVGATLVLIDGHRMAPYPIGDDAQRQFVDVSNIPFDAIDRIEILKDGASSVYGSDAIAGVVNVILKKTFNGTSASADVGNSQLGGGKTVHATVTHGVGDLQKDGWNAFASAEYRHADAIKQYQRDDQEWDNPDWTSRGGINLTRGVQNAQNGGRVAASVPFFFDQTGVGVPAGSGLPGAGRGAAYNPANYSFLTADCDYAKYNAGGCAVRDVYSNLQPETKNLNFLVGFTKLLGADWKLTAKASAFSNRVENNRGVPLTYPTGTGSFSGNTVLIPGQVPKIVQVINPFLAPANYPGNPYGKAVRLYGYVPGLPASSSVDVKNTSYRYVADLEGTLGAWDVAAALGHTKVVNDIGFSGGLNRQALYDAMMRPTNPLLAAGPISEADMAAIAPTYENRKTSELNFVEVRGSRSLMELSGGSLGLSIGTSYTQKKYDSPSPALTQTGAVGNTPAYAFGNEKIAAAFIEVAAPVLKNLELDASARFDHYDTYGNSSTPKVGFKYTPTKALAVRGTYSRGFRAPGAAENGVAGSVFSAGSINDPVLCADGKATTPGNVIAACNFAAAGVQITTPDIRPEKSRAMTLGLIIEPIKNWSTTLDYYNVEIRDQITSASGLPDFEPVYVRYDPVPTAIATAGGGTVIATPAVGQIAYSTVGYVNAGSVKTNGFEFETRYRFKLGDMGNLRTSFQFTHMISYEITDPSGTTVQVAGTHGPNAVGGNTGTPKNRAQFVVGYEKGGFNATTTMNWVGSFSQLDPTVGHNDCYSAIKSNAGRAYFFNTSPSNPPPERFCHVASFLSTDLTLSYKINNNWTLNGTILNVFNRAPPIDVGTYGNASTLTAYNPAFHQAGAVGRFFSVGAKYRF
jgi:iron complex outermembrane receptor protein